MKKRLAEKRFDSNTEIINGTNVYFESLEKSSYYTDGIKNLENYFNKYIELKGHYVKKKLPIMCMCFFIRPIIFRIILIYTCFVF